MTIGRILLAATYLSTAGIAFGTGVVLAQDEKKFDSEKDLGKALDTIADENASANDRTRAVQAAMGLTGITNNEALAKRKDEFRKTLDSVLKSLGAKTSRTADQEKVAAACFRAISLAFQEKGFPELAKLTKPFLTGPAASDTRVQLLAAIQRAGAPGAGADLSAFIESPYNGKPSKDNERRLLEPAVIRATRGLPGNEALDVLSTVINKSKLMDMKDPAVIAIGDFVVRRKARDYDRNRVLTILKDVAKLKGISLETGDLAARALLRHNCFDGLVPVFERLDGKVPQPSTYQTVCIAALKPDGFAALPPKSFDQTQGQPRDDAIAAAHEWWNTAQKGNPDKVIHEALGAEGIGVPKDTASRDYVTALIDGLCTQNFTLRKAVLDLLTQKIQRPDFALSFRKLTENAGSGTLDIFIESEVDDSIENDKRQLPLLMTQQEEKAKKLRAAWDKVKDKATYDGGVWNIPWEPEPKKGAGAGSSKKP